jgi:hypothetical protein
VIQGVLIKISYNGKVNRSEITRKEEVMRDQYIRAVMAGLFFTAWPIFMNRSGLTGNISSAIFAFGCCLVCLPFAALEYHNSSGVSVSRLMIVGACVFGGAGALAFNAMLAKASPQQISALIVLTLVVQTVSLAAYQAVVNGGITLSKIIGFAAAIVAAFLLI